MSQCSGGKAARQRRHERRADFARAHPVTFSKAACTEHPHEGEVWVTCTHTKGILSARFITHPEVTGEALCSECQKMVEARTPHLAQLRLACGACIRAHFRLTREAVS